MGMVILTFDLMKAVRGQKHPFEAKNGMKELIYWTTSRTPKRVQSDLSYNLRVESYDFT